MRINRTDLEQHLNRITCRGQINQAVFVNSFGAAALTSDMLLLVIAPPLADVEPLAQEIGLANLEKLRAASRAFDESDEETADDLDVTVENDRLVFRYARGNRIILLTAAPRTIATKVPPETVKQLFGQIGSLEVTLLRSTIDDVRSVFGELKADEVQLVVGPEGGMIRVGGLHADQAEVPIPELTAPTEYELTFSGHLIDVLATVVEDDPVLVLAGAGKLIAVKDGEYTYLLSPRARSVERKQAATKQKGAKKDKAARQAAVAASAATE